MDGKQVEYAVPLSKPASTEIQRRYRKRNSTTKLGDRLREIRTILDKNVPQMAKTVEVSAASWGSYESGKTVPGSNVLETLAGIGFDPGWLLTGRGQPVAEAKGKSADTLIVRITTYDELKELLHKTYDDTQHCTADLLFDAWTAAFTAVEDYCLYTGELIDTAKKEIIYVQLVREYLWGRNSYDGKKIHPQIVKNLFMLAKYAGDFRGSALDTGHGLVPGQTPEAL